MGEMVAPGIQLVMFLARDIRRVAGAMSPAARSTCYYLLQSSSAERKGRYGGNSNTARDMIYFPLKCQRGKVMANQAVDDKI